MTQLDVPKRNTTQPNWDGSIIKIKVTNIIMVIFI